MHQIHNFNDGTMLSSSPQPSIEDVIPHLQTTLYITGAFVVAWSWDLVVYSSSHVWYGEDPLDHQLGFGNQRAPKHLVVLLAQYLGVCGAAAFLSNRVRRRCHGGYREVAVLAIEFFPSPVFAGKLMAYLTQFRLQSLQQALLNLAATWFAAFLVQVVVTSSPDGGNSTLRSTTVGFWHRTGLIIRDTLGFGLGIAWNSLLGDIGPSQHSQLDFLHIMALVCYLLMVLVMALKLAAIVPDQPVSIWERHLSLLAFAMYVVCGFTLVGFLNTVLGDGWIGSLASFGIVLGLAATMSTMVALADLDGMLENAHGYDEETNRSSWEYRPSKFGPFGGILNFCIFVPCVWCCCPWVPILIVLAGMTESVNVKEHWFRLIAMVAGLSSSIEGSSLLTTSTDMLAKTLGICGSGHCYAPWLFVALQVGLAIACTIIILPVIARLAPAPNEDSSMTPTLLAPSAPSEDAPLLYSTPPLMPPPPALNPHYDPSRL
jgi:hypothetical protein